MSLPPSLNSLELLGALSARLAHALSNQLSIVTGNVCVAHEIKDEPDKLAAALKSALHGADQAGKLLSRFVDLRRSIAINTPITPLTEVLEILSSWCREHDWRLDGALMVSNQAIQLPSSWLIFIVDAISRKRPTGTIRTSVSRHSFQLVIVTPEKPIDWDKIRSDLSDFHLAAAYELLTHLGARPDSWMNKSGESETRILLSLALL
jgi:hypothetical protein